MKRIIALLLPLLAAFPLLAQTAIRVDAPNMVSTSEQFNVTFIIEGEDSPSDFQWDQGSDFQLVWGPQKGTSTSVSIINGKRSRSSQTTYTYVLMPKKTGTFKLPQATARLDGKEISSASLSIEVVADSSSSSSGGQGTGPSSGQSSPAASSTEISDDDLFLKLSLSRTSVVVGEPVTATLKLYQRVSIAGFEDAKFPVFNGFWSQETFAPTNIEFTRENYNGGLYNSAVLRSWTLIPQQSGDISIEPAELVCLVNIRVPSVMGSIFDSFFQDEYRTIRKRINSKGYTVKVSALPAGAPASFGGGVGKFSMKVDLSADELKTHDAASLKVTVSGSGNVALLEAPKVNFPPDFEVYDVKTSDIQGAKVFEYPFIPRSYGDFEIPPVEYSYFDIDTHKYVTLTSESLPLKVERGNASESSSAGVLTAVNRKDVKDIGSDIRYIATKQPSFKESGRFFAFSPAFWILAAALLLLWAAALVLLKRGSARRQDVAAAKNRKATALARKKLAQAGEFLKKNLYTAYYEELHKALLGFVGDKLNMDPADMSKDNIASALVERGVVEALASDFTGLLDACEFARYAPSGGQEAMDAHYQSAVNVISAIDEAMKNKKKTPAGGTAAMLILLLLAPANARARQDYPDSLWTAGVEAYADGRWSDALDAWNGIEALGVESAQLYYNIGNAYFKDGDYAHAILFYERSLKLDPSSADAKHNLQFANGFIQDNINSVPEFFLVGWFRSVTHMLSRDAWAVLFLLFLGIALAMALLFLVSHREGARKSGFYAGLVALVLAVLCFGAARSQCRDALDGSGAIVTRPIASVKSSPGGGSSAKDLFMLHEGAKVKVLDTVGDWNNIEIPDGRQGWLLSSDIEII